MWITWIDGAPSPTNWPDEFDTQEAPETFPGSGVLTLNGRQHRWSSSQSGNAPVMAFTPGIILFNRAVGTSPTGWRRATAGSAHVVGVDWIAF